MLSLVQGWLSYTATLELTPGLTRQYQEPLTFRHLLLPLTRYSSAFQSLGFLVIGPPIRNFSPESLHSYSISFVHPSTYMSALYSNCCLDMQSEILDQRSRNLKAGLIMKDDIPILVVKGHSYLLESTDGLLMNKTENFMHVAWLLSCACFLFRRSPLWSLYAQEEDSKSICIHSSGIDILHVAVLVILLHHGRKFNQLNHSSWY